MIMTPCRLGWLFCDCNGAEGAPRSYYSRLGLPAGDGFAVLKRLQESDTLSSIPVVVLTARSADFNEQKTLQAGATAFFQKPADNRELLAVIRAALPSNLPAVALPS